MELFLSLLSFKNEIVVFNIYRNTDSQKKTLRFVSQQQYYKADLDYNFLSPHFHRSDGLPVHYYALLPNVCNWYTISLLSSLYSNSWLFFLNLWHYFCINPIVHIYVNSFLRFNRNDNLFYFFFLLNIM